MGYIKYNSMCGSSEKYISLTDKGKCYFEVNKDNRIDFIKKDIVIPVIVSIVVTLITLIITNCMN